MTALLQAAALALVALAAIGTATALLDACRAGARRTAELADPAAGPDDRRWP